MKLNFMLLTVVGVAASQPNRDFNFGEWHPPRRGDVRSPCPGLNSLANHGFIPRNGRGLGVPMLVEALGVRLNVSRETVATLATAALRTSSNPARGTFDLDDLAKHNVLEHDGSLTRKDFDAGEDNSSFDKEVWKEFLGYLGDEPSITIPAAAAARWGRIKSSKAKNPNFTYSPANRFNSHGETALYLELFRDPTTMTTSRRFVEIFFQQERLPLKEGWRPDNIISGFSLASDILALSLFTPEETPDFGSSGALHGVMIPT